MNTLFGLIRPFPERGSWRFLRLAFYLPVPGLLTWEDPAGEFSGTLRSGLFVGLVRNFLSLLALSHLPHDARTCWTIHTRYSFCSVTTGCASFRSYVQSWSFPTPQGLGGFPADSFGGRFIWFAPTSLSTPKPYACAHERGVRTRENTVSRP